MRITWLNRFRRSARPRTARPITGSLPTAHPVHLPVEALEAREATTTGPFYLATHGGLWSATDTTAKLSRFTGLTGTNLSVGQFGGGQFAVVRDAQRHIAIFNGNNDVITTTDIVARDVLGGRSEIFYRDPLNHVGVLTLGAVLNGDGTFAVTPVATDGVAVQMRLGRDTTTGADFLAFRAPNRNVHVLEMVAGTPVRADSGAKAIDLDAGNEREVFIRKANNQVDVLTINTATAMGITFSPVVNSGKAATSLSIGRGSPFGDDVMAYRSPDGGVHYMRYFPGA